MSWEARLCVVCGSASWHCTDREVRQQECKALGWNECVPVPGSDLWSNQAACRVQKAGCVCSPVQAAKDLSLLGPPNEDGERKRARIGAMLGPKLKSAVQVRRF